MDCEAFMNLLGSFTNFFKDFESYLRTEIDLIEDDFELWSREYVSNFLN